MGVIPRRFRLNRVEPMTDVLDAKDLGPEALHLSAVELAEPVTERRRTQRRKLTIDVSADLHQRIIAICATRRIPVNQAVRDVLEQAFPGR